MFEKSPEEMLQAAKGDDGEIVFEETGDSLIDKWEQELMKGLTPDLTESMSPENIAKMRKSKEQKKKASEVASQLDGINETYGKPNSAFDSKFIPIGSMEETRLLNEKLLGRVGRMSDSFAFGDKKVK